MIECSGQARDAAIVAERSREVRRALALPALLALLSAPLLAACSGAPAARGTAAAASASASADVGAPRGCDVAALEAKGDLDGVLLALDACGELSLDERMRRVDVLVTLGDVEAAKASAADVARRARGAGSAGDAIQRRADQVLSLDVVTRASKDELADARALVDKARSEREPARWIDLARARHAYTRATGTRGKPVLVARDVGQALAGDHALFQVLVRDLAGGDTESATAIADRDPRTSALGVVKLVSPRVRLDQSSPIAPLFGEPGAFVMQTEGGIRAVFTERKLTPIVRGGSLALSPNGRVLVVEQNGEITVIDLVSWTPRFTHRGSSSTVARVTDDVVIMVGSHLEGVNDVVDLADGKVRLHVAGVGAVSPDGRTLATLTNDSPDPSVADKIQLHLHAIEGASTERVVQLSGASGYGVIDFDHRGRARVSEYGPSSQVCVMEARTLADVATGRSVPITKDERYRDCPGAGTFVELAPTPTGLTAKAESYAPLPELVVSKGGVVAQRVPLAMSGGFGVASIVATADERFVLACGAGGAAGAFVVDVTTGRTTFLSDVQDCSSSVFSGSRVAGANGVRDLTSDQSAPDWPTTSSLSLVGASAFTELANAYVPTSTKGLYCRFDELVAPYEVCGPPPPPPGAREKGAR